MKIDPEKLRLASVKARTDRTDKRTASGLQPRSLMVAIRNALPIIDSLRAAPHEERPTWEDIAEALTSLGMKTRKGEPITALRLTSLVHAVKAQDAARAKKDLLRQARADLPPLSSKSAPPEPRLQVSIEQKPKRREPPRPNADRFEDEIRREQFNRLGKLFKEQ
jgi:hypothetical protein